jgi:nucleoside-diphosphate kinase
MPTQRTLILVKPDGVRRGLIGEIIARFERKGLMLVGMKLMRMTMAQAQEHYAEHKERPFFGELTEFITSGPLVAMAWEGPGAIGLSRTLMGATKVENAQPGSIRGDFATTTGENLVHGSDSEDSAARELAIFFSDEEFVG